MDKERIRKALIEQLRKELDVVRASAASAREGATHEDAKPENEYDTRALEQSYLAGAQAARCASLENSIGLIEELEIKFDESVGVDVGAFVRVDDGEKERSYFFAPAGGGTKVSIEGEKVTILTLASPLGRVLRGKKEGDEVEHLARGESFELQIISVC